MDGRFRAGWRRGRVSRSPPGLAMPMPFKSAVVLALPYSWLVLALVHAVTDWPDGGIAFLLRLVLLLGALGTRQLALLSADLGMPAQIPLPSDISL